MQAKVFSFLLLFLFYKRKKKRGHRCQRNNRSSNPGKWIHFSPIVKRIRTLSLFRSLSQACICVSRPSRSPGFLCSHTPQIVIYEVPECAGCGDLCSLMAKIQPFRIVSTFLPKDVLLKIIFFIYLHEKQ